MKKRYFLFALLAVWSLCLGSNPAWAVEMDPYPVFDLSRDPFSVSLFREERPSFYWVNIGVPDFFFNGVQQTSGPPGPIVYSVRSIEYGVQTKGWLTDQLQMRLTIPFEANAMVDPSGNTHNLAKIGDVEVGATYLVTGNREKGNFIGLDGWYRFPTGTNPFTQTYPLLSTGKGAPQETLGVVMAEELGGFSFFQSIHYAKTQPVILDSSNSLLGAGTFQWPDDILAEGRAEYLVFHRAQRFISFYADVRFRMSGLLEFNRQALPYGQGQMTDQLFFQTYGILVRVDKEFSAQGEISWFPSELTRSRPDFGNLFTLSLVFRPI